MVSLTLIVSIILIATGVAAYIATAAASITALIPAFVGVLLLVCALIARNDRVRKPVLIVALVLALLGAGGSVQNVMGLGDLFAGEADNPGAVVASAIMLVALVVLLIGGVRWLLASRDATTPPPEQPAA